MALADNAANRSGTLSRRARVGDGAALTAEGAHVGAGLGWMTWNQDMGAGDDQAESFAELRIAELEARVAAIKEQVDCSDSFNTPSVRVNDKCWSKIGCEPWYMQNHIIRRLAESAIREPGNGPSQHG